MIGKLDSQAVTPSPQSAPPLVAPSAPCPLLSPDLRIPSCIFMGGATVLISFPHCQLRQPGPQRLAAEDGSKSLMCVRLMRP